MSRYIIHSCIDKLPCTMLVLNEKENCYQLFERRYKYFSKSTLEKQMQET